MNNDCTRKNVSVRGEAARGEEGTVKRWRNRVFGGRVVCPKALLQRVLHISDRNMLAHSSLTAVPAGNGLCLGGSHVRRCSHIKYHHSQKPTVVNPTPSLQ